MYLKVVFFCGMLLLASCQVLLPISNCLSNCWGCERKNPNTCFNQTLQAGQGRCLPYYDGNNCTIGNSYYVPLPQRRISTAKTEC